MINVIEYINNNEISKDEFPKLKSMLRAYFRIRGRYITNTELERYLNKEIKFEDIRDKIQELSQAKNQEEYTRIENDLLF